MLTKDTLYIGEEGRKKIISGIKKAADSVGSTMGTGGSNFLIECIEHPGSFTTNDGATGLEAMRFADPMEEMGRKILLESVKRANKNSGDGSSTTAVLTSAILEEGVKYLDQTSRMEIKRSLEACIPLIEESIKKQTRQIAVNEVGAVASISSEDEGIGKMIQEIYEKIGKDGIINWDISKTEKDSYTIGEGITVEGSGYYSPYMCNATPSGQSTGQIRIKNPTVMIIKQRITSAQDFNDINHILYTKDIRDIVVFCDEVDPLVVPDIIKTRFDKGFRMVLVKLPTLWGDWWAEDLALASGAKIISPNAGLPLRNATMDDLGTFGNITITKTDTYIDGIKDVSTHIKKLEDEATDDSKLRASRLNTKTARYFVGAGSDQALAYRRLKVEDAISASYHALQKGVVPGGGVSPLMVSKSLPQTIGGFILREALLAPVKQIVSNVGFIPWTEKKWYQIRNKHPYIYISGDDFQDGWGLDTKTRTFVNMFDAHITDPSPIVLNAIKNAISVSASILTTDSIILLPREEQIYKQMPSNVI